MFSAVDHSEPSDAPTPICISSSALGLGFHMWNLTTSDAATRLRRNFAYFRANYAIAVLLVLLFCLLSQPSTFLAIAALFALWFFLYLSREGPLILFNRVVDDGAVLSVLSAGTVVVVVVFLTQVGWNLIGSVTLGVVLVGLHAVFRSAEDLFLGEMDAVNAGLISAGVAPKLPTYIRAV